MGSVANLISQIQGGDPSQAQAAPAPVAPAPPQPQTQAQPQAQSAAQPQAQPQGGSTWQKIVQGLHQVALGLPGSTNRRNAQAQQQDIDIQKQQEEDAHQKRLQEQQEAELELHNRLMTMGAKPVIGGMVQDEQQLPDYMQGLGLPANRGPQGVGATGDTSPAGPAVPQRVTVMRPADKTRIHSFTDINGEKATYELPTTEEAIARSIKLNYPAQQAAAKQAGAVARETEVGREAGLQQARETSGVTLPEGSGPASGMPVLPGELPGIVQGSVIAQEAGSNIRKAQLASAAQTLGAATNPIAYRQAFSNLPPDVQQYFDQPDHFDPVQSPMRARMLNMAPADQQKAALQMMTAPEEWDAKVDANYPVTGTNPAEKAAAAQQNTAVKTTVRGLIKRGEFDKADALIEKGSEQMGKTITGVATARATAPIKINLAAATADARAPKISDAGVDLMAEQLINGQPVSMRSPVLYAKAQNAAAQKLAERGLTPQAAVMAQNAAKSSRAALTQVNTQYQKLKPFADMAEKNATVLEQKIADVSDLGAPILNTPLRSLEKNFAGNPKVAAFHAALLPVQADFARILNSPTGSGALTNEAREEMQKALDPGATPAMIHAALNVYRTDAKNRVDAYTKDLEDLKQQTVVGGAPATPAASAAPAAQAITEGTVIVNPQTKQRLVMKGGQWAPAP